jgi:hypothetical protein
VIEAFLLRERPGSHACRTKCKDSVTFGEKAFPSQPGVRSYDHMVTDTAAYFALALLGLGTIVFGFIPIFRDADGDGDRLLDAWDELSTH